MTENQLLSEEEKDALSRAAAGTPDLHEIMGSHEGGRRQYERAGQLEMMDCIIAAFQVEAEKNINSFLRKKLVLGVDAALFGVMSDFVPEDAKNQVYNIYYVHTANYFCLFVMDYLFLHQAINILFGGRVNINEPVMTTPGRIGLAISAGIAGNFMNAFVTACKDFGEVSYQHVRTSVLPVLVTRMARDDRVYAVKIGLVVDDLKSSITMLVTADFMRSLVPQTAATDASGGHENFAKQKIQKLLMDSMVTLVASLPETSISVRGLAMLKAGDLLPVPNPTNVLISVGEKKLFKGIACESNASLVVKLTDKYE